MNRTFDGRLTYGTAADLPPVTDPLPIPKQITHWHGDATGSWWAILPGPNGPYLVEEASEEHLATTVHWRLRHPAP